ncbi:MAG: DUF3090 family protein [Chloroflexi bacterium]|nr:DUF3090 family protein [Chloroflexota bacterium]
MPNDPHYELGHTVRLNADAVGEPGQRRFRILVDAAGGTATIWLEKEQMHSLAVSVSRLLEIVESEGRDTRSSGTERSRAFRSGSRATLDFQSGSWSLGYDEDQRVVEFHAHELDDDDDSPKVSFVATAEQCRAWSQEALELYSAGRPTCPLCNAPMSTGETHNCPRANGHAKV